MPSFFSDCNTLADRVKKFICPPKIQSIDAFPASLVAGLCRYFVYEHACKGGVELSPAYNIELQIAICFRHAVSRLLHHRRVETRTGFCMFCDFRNEPFENSDWTNKEPICRIDGVRPGGGQLHFTMPDHEGCLLDVNALLIKLGKTVMNPYVVHKPFQSRAKMKELLLQRRFDQVGAKFHYWLCFLGNDIYDASACLLPAAVQYQSGHWGTLPLPPGLVIGRENVLTNCSLYISDRYSTAIANGMMRQVIRLQCTDGGWCGEFADWFDHRMIEYHYGKLDTTLDCPWQHWNKQFVS